MKATPQVLLTRLIHFIRQNKREHTNPITIEESYCFDPSFDIHCSMREVIAAMEKISVDMILGEGTLGLVYRAQLSTGLRIAVKKFSPNCYQGFMEFRSELETLGKIRHQNIVRILGYCVSGHERLLIYEFFEEGSLDRRLHYKPRSRSRSRSPQLSWSPLPWETRNKIIKGVASGLAYMHDLEKPIIHRNVKASNVLLDSKFEAHISDFGLARMMEPNHTHVSTQAAGTPGYMPPEYEDGCAVATASGDVYSFGVLMLEVATGKRPNFPVYLNDKEMSFMEGVRTMVAKDCHMEMLDPNIRGCECSEGLKEAHVKEYFRIAVMCTNVIPQERPPIRDVVELLTQIFT
ncbi:Tyrosine-protein kinase [Parasponia andersonii]|uniref:non-specific serine/threonine protein kinase n=1 Tax=Parasponia andersonii TaxID=3476 RepID=A0A2P5BV58_PARAD|nr:Tyrosine-protein kinase [Parasponia andersonii]